MDVPIFPMPFLVKPLDCMIIPRVRLSGEDLPVAFTS